MGSFIAPWRRGFVSATKSLKHQELFRRIEMMIAASGRGLQFPAFQVMGLREKLDHQGQYNLGPSDDESLGFGGTLAKYAAEEVEIHLVTATRGERGRAGSRDKEAEPAEVGRLREAEIRAAAVLGIRSVEFLGYPDGGVDQIDPAVAMLALVRHIRRIQPHVVVTFGPEGGYGHPDHIAISQFTRRRISIA